MNGEGRRLNVIHQSLVRPILLAGAERPLAIANWITAAALILGAGHLVHGRSRSAAGDSGSLALVQRRRSIRNSAAFTYARFAIQDRYPARASSGRRRRRESGRPCRSRATRERNEGMRREMFKEFRDLRRKPERGRACRISSITVLPKMTTPSS